MVNNNEEPQPTHIAYGICSSPDHPPEIVRLGRITNLKDGDIVGRFTSIPASGWNWEFHAVPIGSDPPAIPDEHPPKKKPAQQSRPLPQGTGQPYEPLPGEEGEPQGLFGGDQSP